MFARYVRYFVAALLPVLLTTMDVRGQLTNEEYQALVRHYSPTPSVSSLLGGSAVEVRLADIEVPDSVLVGEEARFTAHVNLESATMPIDVTWTMGDGTSLRGLNALHTYDRPGEFEVRLHIVNPVSEEERVVHVTAITPDDARSTDG